MKRSYILKILKYLGLNIDDNSDCDENPPKIWLRCAKLPPYGEGLAEKDYQGADQLCPTHNQFRCPKILSNRNFK